jgi:Tfp pilus assembly protein PilF
MQTLEPSDIHRLNAVYGWLGLNSLADARAELEAMTPALQSHPSVLEARWVICVHEENWRDGLIAAEREVALLPDESAGWLHRAYALRRVAGGSLKQAWDALLPAAAKFPTEPIVAYNLSCYACQMNQPDNARVWLQRAVEAGGRKTIQKMALADVDLRPLWPEIEKW